MINFATLQGLTIPEGVVTQITDASGRVLWKLNAGGPVVLQVEKITTDTYAGSTTYTGEEFILLDIYPKTNGTVSVTYGGLTKTITDTSGVAEPNAQQVFFGTFNGVSDSVATPANGELIIEGGCNGFGVSKFAYTSKMSDYNCPCITGVDDWGGVTNVRPYAFYNCTRLASVPHFESITSIGDYAFYGCSALELSELPRGIASIGNYVFYGCNSITFSELPSGITSIGDYAFEDCYKLTLSSLPEGITSIGRYAFYQTTFIDKDYDYLDKITLPSSVTSIGDHAFSGSPFSGSSSYFSRWRNVHILATTPPTGKVTMFGTPAGFGTSKKIIVPAGCGEAYKAADGWSEYADYIVEAS